MRKENKMKICVQGTWHLGSVTAACLADKGHKVIGLDYDTNVINSLSKPAPTISNARSKKIS